MPVPTRLKHQLLARFDALIVEGQSIYDGRAAVPGKSATSGLSADTRADLPHYDFDWSRVVIWRTRCVSLLGMFLPGMSVHQNVIPRFTDLSADISSFEWAFGTLKALRADLADDTLDTLASRVEAEVVADLMTQAESLLGEETHGRHAHAPAAVLTGAVLEKALRTLSTAQQPPIATTDADGRPLKAVVLIDLLKRAGLFNETAAKQLRAWFSIRNECAHGHGDRVTPEQVRLMVEGVRSFLARHLG